LRRGLDTSSEKQKLVARGFAKATPGTAVGLFGRIQRHARSERDEAIHASFTSRDGLLRFARNDGREMGRANASTQGAAR
jgi:hypothetical protein